ncbi:PEGA domain-containing protein [Pendulispora rubella]|uniref:PEGA domain-containing protein n=1 Tax=Pendulispora rubella TaxID=2741070 RepID=A0ABZ2L3H9_9BACT
MNLRIGSAVLFAVLVGISTAHAEEPTPRVPEADEAFAQGMALVRSAHWAEALVAFERANELQPHAVTTHNIGACERAMGHYTRAHRAFARALAQNDAAGGTALRPDRLLETKAFLAEMDRLLVRLRLDVTPSGSRVTVDGRPLDRVRVEADEYMAGVRPPGLGDESPHGAFVVLLDPGVHLLVFSRPGFEDALVHRTLAAGQSLSQRIELTEMPAQIHVSSNRPGAIVRVGGRDVGPTPVDVRRPAGSYLVTVERDGFERYEARINVRAGQEADLHATLVERSPTIFQRWWFWTGAAVVVTGAAVATYALTRGDRPEVGGGTIGWGAVVP